MWVKESSYGISFPKWPFYNVIPLYQFSFIIFVKGNLGKHIRPNYDFEINHSNVYIYENKVKSMNVQSLRSH